MTEWREVKLGDVCLSVSYGYTASATQIFSGAKFLRITDIVPYFIDWDAVPYCKISEKDFKKYKLNIGDIVIARTGATTGYNAVIEHDFNAVYASYLIRFKPNKEIFLPKFAKYILKTTYYKKFIENNISGSAQPGINAQTLSLFSFLLPPLDVQRKIAGVLGALDDKIELNNKINQNLEAQAQALFKSWFIDFEPFGGKMPNDWKIGKLSDIAEYSNDTISTEFTSFENYISTENMLPNRGGISRASSLPTGNTVKSYRTTDVLISNIRPYFKKIWFALFSGGCSNDILVFRSKKDSPAFVFNVLNQDDFFEYVMSGANGSKMPRGDKKHIMQYKVIIPSAKTIKEFENIAITFLEKFSDNNQENVRLAELRDTLLPKLMSGEINVDNVEMD